MVTKPDILINKAAKFGQLVLLVIAGFCVLLTIGSIGNGNIGGAILFGAVGLGLAVWAGNIKTTYHRRGGVDFYK
tara:strand:+ start:14060 stop:14284 length:225 start_codon:yes stop_codon:yes gene_type:complete